MVTKEQTIALLESISRLLELKGENPFKIRAYTNAARALETFSGNFPNLVEEKRLEELEGIGSAIAKKIEEFATTGALGYYQELSSSFPDTLSELFELQGLGAKKIKVLWETLKVKSIADLEAACRDGRVAELPGFGEKTAENFLRAIESRGKPVADIEQGHISTASCILANLSMQLGRSLTWDAGKHQVVGDAEATRLLRRPYRAPWVHPEVV